MNEEIKTNPAVPVDTDTPLSETPRYPIPTRTIWDPIEKNPSGAAEAFWAPKPKMPTPYAELIPEDSDSLGRRGRVARNVADGVLNEKNFRQPSNEDRPKTLPERVMAWRIVQKKFKADKRNMEISSIADRYSYSPDPDNPGQIIVDFGSKDELAQLSRRERRQVKRDEKRYNKLRKQAIRLMVGRTVPLTDTRFGGFAQIAGSNVTSESRSRGAADNTDTEARD